MIAALANHAAVTKLKTYAPYVPPRLLRNMYRHLERNLSNQPGPLLQGIHGPPGVGKTFALHRLLNLSKVQPFILSCAEVEDAEAGQPARRLRELYADASRAMTKPRIDGAHANGDGLPLSALVIDDCDVGLGDWGEKTQYTVNRQLILGELMHLADDPLSLGKRRVPIFMIGNDLSKIYRPLLRTGRMTLLPWKMTDTEKARAVQGILCELSDQQVRHLCRRFPGVSLAFFAEVRRLCQENANPFELMPSNPAFSLRQAAAGRAFYPPLPVTFDDVLHYATELRKNRWLANHLAEDVS